MPAVPEIKATVNQVGVMIEARLGNGEWMGVQLIRFASRASGSVRQYSTCIDPARDIEDYFQDLDRRRIAYKRVR